MMLNSKGYPVFEGSDIISLLYNNKTVKLKNLLFLSDDIDVQKYNKFAHEFDLTKLSLYNNKDSNLDSILQNTWLMPSEYQHLDIEHLLLAKCNTKTEYDRTFLELSIFKKKQMLNLLRFLHYLVNTAKENKILIGIGRGSSVASFCLFLLGVHKINSIKYDLNFNDFLKD